MSRTALSGSKYFWSPNYKGEGWESEVDVKPVSDAVRAKIASKVDSVQSGSGSDRIQQAGFKAWTQSGGSVECSRLVNHRAYLFYGGSAQAPVYPPLAG